MTSHAQTKEYQNIAAIIQGRPAVSLSRLPETWCAIAERTDGTALSDQARLDYIEAARLFRHHGTPLAMEALSAIGQDFDRTSYPDFDMILKNTKTAMARRTAQAVKALFEEFGYDVPGSFYQVILATVLRDKPDSLLEMFKNKNQLMEDRLLDAVLHAMLLVTPVGLRIQSVLSQHGLRFTHVMNCGCNITETAEAPFIIALDKTLKPAYLQNLVAAAFEQYGVNASTSRTGRGF